MPAEVDQDVPAGGRPGVPGGRPGVPMEAGPGVPAEVDRVPAAGTRCACGGIPGCPGIPASLRRQTRCARGGRPGVPSAGRPGVPAQVDRVCLWRQARCTWREVDFRCSRGGRPDVPVEVDQVCPEVDRVLRWR